MGVGLHDPLNLGDRPASRMFDSSGKPNDGNPADLGCYKERSVDPEARCAMNVAFSILEALAPMIKRNIFDQQAQPCMTVVGLKEAALGLAITVSMVALALQKRIPAHVAFYGVIIAPWTYRKE